MLNQAQVGRYFDQCHDDSSINEVLSAYVVCKFLGGSDSAQVLRKLYYLSCFLRVTGRSHILRIGETAFKAISFETAQGGGRIGVSAASTKPGIELYNMIRRSLKKNYTTSTITDRTYGGPGAIPAFLSPRQRAQLRRLMDSDHRPAWMERYFSARCGVLDAIAFTLPDYDSQRDTLPLYVSQDIIDGLESVERVLHESRIEHELEEAQGIR